MQNDLFGNAITSAADAQEWYLKNKDQDSLAGRIKRLKHLHKLNPDGMSIAADYETAAGYVEMQWCFIEVFYLSTILLSQSLIEKILHDRFNKMGEEKTGKKGLSAMLKHIRTERLLDEFLVNKIDHIRQIRNPITHLKEMGHEHGLDQRHRHSNLSSQQQLEQDAKDALEVATWLILSKLNGLVWVCAPSQ
jgi:hypothetical protein